MNELLTTDLDRARQEKEQTKKYYAEAEFNRRQLQEQNTKFRAIFIKNGKNDNEPLEDVLIQSFCDLREQIQKIVQKQYTDRSVRLESHKNPLFDKQKAFFRGPWMHPNVPLSTKFFHMRARLFEFLREEIFQPDTFGVEGRRETHLADFEAALRSCRTGQPSAKSAPDLGI